MILLIDAGNSRLKWACLQGKKLQPGGAVPRSAASTRDFATAWDELEPPEAVFVTSVAGDKFDTTLTNWLKRKWKCEPTFLTTRAKGFGVTNAYVQPERLGVDRWLALIGAHDAWNGPVCIVDCGTAVTLDAMRGDGTHAGGLIVPGLVLMQDSLKEKASGIGDISLNPEASTGLLATDTGNAVIAGSLYSLVALIERVVGDLSLEWKEPVQCLVTGGDAEQLLPLLMVKAEHCPDLLFTGMAVVARQSGAAQPPARTKEKKRA
ncbi:transcriptional regulator [Thiohalobacter thiocyanaticus]|uniref:Type III pantothenate kinase n=1 Tax=Thiohalobacter thiocyanaticus TaxID=585455 RepID=A0A1Z4VTZ5_9GAMM|nr:type III pantothenate kinase [Thiohalobacter thiocyanaticus]BAZ95107.1 transcriptional regulator [Thiohalobacter thiocyanaticus]